MAGVTEVARIEPSAPVFLDVRTETEARAALKAARARKDLAEAERTRAQAELEYTAAEVERLVRDDPFWPTGLRQSVKVLEWKQVFAHGKRLIP